MIYVNMYKTEKGYIIAMCDEELIGTVIMDKERSMDLKKYASFYKNELLDENEAEKIVDVAGLYSANIVGERAVGIFIRKGIAKKEEVSMIGGVPIIQLFSMS